MNKQQYEYMLSLLYRMKDNELKEYLNSNLASDDLKNYYYEDQKIKKRLKKIESILK